MAKKKAKKRGRKKAPKVNRMFRYFRGLLTIVFLLGFVLLISSYFVRLEVIKRVKNRALASSAVVLSSPFSITKGIHFRGSKIPSRLNRLGYQRVSLRPKDPGEYYFDSDQAFIFLRKTYNPDQRTKLISIDLDSTGKIQRIWDEKFKQVSERVWIEPEVLSLLGQTSSRSYTVKKLSQFPKLLIKAVVAIEDERFFDHFGVDPIAIARALYVNLKSGRIVQGGSTLTQQLAKNLFFTHERSIKRKIVEAISALLIETAFTKKQILEFYLNEIYLSQEGKVAIHGFGEASKSFFGKDVEELNLAEISTLAGIIKAPSSYSPRRHPERAKKRRKIVLAKMQELKMIDSHEKKKAEYKKLNVLPPRRTARVAPYFVDYLRKTLINDFEVDTDHTESIRVNTGLDLEYQECAESAVKEWLRTLEKGHTRLKRKSKPLQAALIAINPNDGQIKAWVGGRDYRKNQFDRVSLAKRQPGSAFKPFVYLTALDRNLNSYRVARTSSILLDEPITLSTPSGPWEPKNYDKKFRGEVTIREALARSLNVPTVNLALKVGIDKIATTAELFGFGKSLPRVPSLALGAGEVTPLEMARAYAAIANGGYLIEISPIKSIALEQNSDAVYQNNLNQERAASESAVFVLTDLMRSVIENGTGKIVKRMGFKRPAAGKTGTSNNSRDSWFAGFTPKLLAVVWVGFDDNIPSKLTGASAAAPIWSKFMNCVSPMEPELNFIPPKGVVFRKIDARTGLLVNRNCPKARATTEVFVEGTEPITPCAPEDRFWSSKRNKTRGKGLIDSLFDGLFD